MNVLPMLSGLLFKTESSAADYLLPAGLILITTSLVAGILRRRKQSLKLPSAREQIERHKQEKGMRNDLESLTVEIEQLAKQLGAQLDAKTVQLEKLLHEADSRINRLQDRLNVREPTVPRADRSEPLPDLNRPARSGETSDSVELQSAGAPQTGLGLGDEMLRRQVCELADNGLTAADIAQRLDEHLGKVELILALRTALAEGTE